MLPTTEARQNVQQLRFLAAIPEYTGSIIQHLQKNSQLSVTPVPGVFRTYVRNNHTCSPQTHMQVKYPTCKIKILIILNKIMK